MSPRCPSELALEQYLLQPERSASSAHVTGCNSCQARLVEMRQEGDEFRRSVYPRTLDAVLERAQGKRVWVRWLWLVPAPVLAAAAMLIVARPSTPADDYSGTKGAGLGLAIYSDGAAGMLASGLS